MSNPDVVYQPISRFSKTFEAILGPGMIKDANFRLNAKEVEGVFGVGESAPEGTCVKLAVPGTSNTKGGVYITYEEGDLEVCDADDTEIYGILLQRVDPISATHPYLRKQFQTAVFVGERVTVGVGLYQAILMDLVGIGTATPAIKDKLYIGTKGKLSLNGQNGATNAGKNVADIIMLDRLPTDRTTGEITVDATHAELTLLVKLSG